MHRLFAVTSMLVLTALVVDPTGEVPAGAAPGPEALLTGVTQVSTGGSHSCARLADGTARCWGYNGDGQLGDGSTDDADTPVVVRNATDTAPLTGVSRISAGFTHTCARLTNGQVRCWGTNTHGQLGNGTTDQSPLPVAVQNPFGTGNLQNVIQVVAGNHYASCAVLTSRQVRCWGDDTDGGLGNGLPTGDRVRPVPVKAVTGTGNLSNVAQIDVGNDFGCARLTNDQVRCWGDNEFGQLGNGSPTDRPRPVVVKAVLGTSGPLTGVTQIGLGDAHACARIGTGQARCWGRNTFGALGNGTDDHSDRPVVVRTVSGSGALAGVTALAGGFGHTCARLGSGQVRCWGENGDGALGDDSISFRLRPVIVQNPAGTGPLGNVTQVAGGEAHSCARLANNQARCWGQGGNGQIGDGHGTNRLRPVAVIV